MGAENKISAKMRSLFLYKEANGVTRRLLSFSTRQFGGHGVSHEGDEKGPTEFFQALTFLSEAQKPDPVTYAEEDLTPEFIAERAAKYNMLPQDYIPMSVS